MRRVYSHRKIEEHPREKRGFNCALKLLRSEIVYDVDYISWKVAQCRISEEESRAEAQTDQENSDWLTRQVETALDNAKDRISAYVVEMSRMQTDEDENRDEWDIVLYMEPGWRGSSKTMNTYIHRYVVDFVLTEWFKMTMPEETAIYVASAKGWLDRFINEARDVVVEDVIFRL